MQDSSNEIKRQQELQTKALFGFARELGRVRRENIDRLDRHPWSLRLADVDATLPGVKKWTEGKGGDVLLSVEQQDLPPCPEPSETLKELLGEGWDRPGWKAEAGLEELLAVDPALLRAFSAWTEKRKGWLAARERCSRSLDLFQELYSRCRFIEDSNLRYVAKAGTVSFASDEAHGGANHPVLSRPVLFRLDVEGGRPSIAVTVDMSEPARFESELLSAYQDCGFRLELCQSVREDVDRCDPHPFAPLAVLPAFERLAATISPESRWAGPAERVRFDERCSFAFFEDPVIWIEERASGMAEASDRIIRRINEGAEIPRHLLDLICGASDEPSAVAAPAEPETLEDRLAAAGGIDPDILLTKPANREQLRVAREIRSEDAVLVMGPPGTGKTHTIANLMGDFLAQGKTVLISSQKEKALRVLKSMMPEPMQDLCVSITSDQDDVLATVQQLTDRLSLIRTDDLARRIEAEEDARKALLSELGALRRALHDDLCREFTPVRTGEEAWTPSSLGRWLSDHSDLAGVIPDQDLPQVPFPFSPEELRELYSLMKSLPAGAAGYPSEGLPKKERFPEPVELAHVLAELDYLRDFLRKNGIRVEPLDGAGESGRIRYSSEEFSVEARKPGGQPMSSLADWLNRDRTAGEPEPWVLAARGAGAAGGALAGRWGKLLEEISAAAALAEKEIGQMDELPVELTDGADRAELREALVYFRDNGISGEPGFLTKLTQKARLAALSCASVSGHAPSAEPEYAAVLLRLDLEERRAALRKLWDDLVAGAGGPRFDALSADHPEEQAKLRYAPRLEKALGWWTDWAAPLLQRLSAIEVNSDALTGGTGAGPVESCEALSRSVERFIRPAAEADRARSRLLALEGQIAAARQALIETDRSNPEIAALCEEVSAGLDGDQAAYERAWSRFVSLDHVQPKLGRRDELFARLEEAAPLWARAMQALSPDAFPENAEEAWKWRQLDARFRKYLETDFGELQKKADRLSARLRGDTVQLAADKAWLALARRLQGNRALMQKLQGWAQIAARIGRGTGRGVEALRSQARELIAECSQAVPCWIMPAEKALSTFDGSWQFDIVIIDEASQSDIVSMPILFLGKKAIIAGDDRQVSPAAVGVGDSAVLALSRQYIQGKVANWPIYQAQASLYDLAKTVYSPQMLREHFRCVPPIIGYSNGLSYGGSILPLRDAASSSLQPPIKTLRVAGVRESNDTNRAEAEAIVNQIRDCLGKPEYDGKSFGVIVMRSGRTGAQIQLINDLLYRVIGPEAIEKRRILCGLSPDFQGDERDVIFLSLVDSPDGDKPLRRETAGSDDGMKKRWNVAVSRARDQVWAVVSFDPETQLQDGDIRKTFFDYLKKPVAGSALAFPPREMPAFTEDVAKSLEKKGYRVIRGYRAGAFDLPLVVEGGGRKAVLECDGEISRPDEERILDEMERQVILERAGWKFVRVRGGEWYRDPEAAAWWLVSDLEEMGVKAKEESEETPAAEPAEEKPETAPVTEPAPAPVPQPLKPAAAPAAQASRAEASRRKREEIIAELLKLGAQVSEEVKKGAGRRKV